MERRELDDRLCILFAASSVFMGICGITYSSSGCLSIFCLQVSTPYAAVEAIDLQGRQLQVGNEGKS